MEKTRLRFVPTMPGIAERIEVTYTCPLNHSFNLVFAADISVPGLWDCPHCGKNATNNSQAVAEEATEESRTHWDMVLERRTTTELADMLAERVADLRSAH